MPPNTLIISANGAIGSAVVDTLAQRGIRPRAFVRDGRSAHARFGASAKLVVGDLRDHAALDDALRGVESVFLACGNVPDQVALELGVIDAARGNGVRRVVKLSALGAAPDAPVAFWRRHATIEGHLIASGIDAVILRPSFFMSNVLAMAGPVRTSATLPVPAGTAAIAMIDPVDVADVAACALLDDAVDAGVLPLTGPEALTFDQAAQHLSVATGRDVAYVDVAPEAAAQAMVAAGTPGSVAHEVLEVFARVRQGAHAGTSPAVERITGRPAHTFLDFTRRHASSFADAPSRGRATPSMPVGR